MSNRLSHSAASKFQECPKAYDFHYNLKLRSKTTSGALLFGSALDAALTTLMKAQMHKGGDYEDASFKEKDPYKTFGYMFRFQDINGQQEYLTTSTKVVYSNSDFDKDLLQEEDYKKIQEILKEENVEALFEKALELKNQFGWKHLDEKYKKIINVFNWFSLYRKGICMLDTVHKEILPNIEQVLGVQEYVKLENNEGDSVIGYVDLICKWKGIEKPVILDFKTSSMIYDRDAVLVSPQLTLYMHALSTKYQDTRFAGFIVLNKHIRKNKTKICSVCNADASGTTVKTCANEIDGKRCKGELNITIKPEVFVQTLINEIPERTEEIILGNMDDINKMIKAGIFSRNLNSCIKNYGKCVYYEKCYRNSDEDLIDLSKEKKNE